MARKITKFIMSVQQDEAGNMTVRIVAAGDDNSHPFGDVTADLTNGQKNSLKSICNNIISKLERE